MTIELNGTAVELTEAATVAEAVLRTSDEPDRRGIAVAVDGEVVPRSAWDKTPLAEGQKVEVVGAIQGG
jgi:sulfur carrier protein